MVTGEVNKLYNIVHNAAESMQDDWEDRYVPSPSGIASCRLRQWFQGTGVERTNRIPVESIKKMESGTVIEDFWREVYTRAGFLVVSPTPPLTVGTMQSRGGDGLLFVEAEEAAAAMGLPQGASVLLELKDLGAWSYMDFVTKGVEEGLPDYWPQVQSYLHGFNRNYCIFHAGMADSSGTKFIWRRIRKLPGDPPPFHIEVIKRKPAVVMNAMSRASEVRWFIENVDPTVRVPLEIRDYNSPVLVNENKYPCGWCGWATACVKASMDYGHALAAQTKEKLTVVQPTGEVPDGRENTEDEQG